VTSSSVYLIDLNRHTYTDLIADGNGAFHPYGWITKYYDVTKAKSDLKINLLGKHFRSVYDCSSTTRKVLIRHYKSISNRHFYRRTFEITSCYNKSIFNKCVIIYYWKDSVPQPVVLKPHGNARHCALPYLRSSNTTLEKIKVKINIFFLSLKSNFLN
jgi:hypothetical protein